MAYLVIDKHYRDENYYGSVHVAIRYTLEVGVGAKIKIKKSFEIDKYNFLVNIKHYFTVNISYIGHTIKKK